VAGPGPDGKPWNFDLAKGLKDKANNAGRWQRIFGSYHPNMCNFAFCDGSVRSFNVNTDPDLLRRLTIKNDGESLDNP